MDDLRRAWDEQADRWIAWARRPGHDTYERWHRDAFLPILPGPGRLTVDLEDYTRAFERNGLLLEALREPAVPDEAVRDDADRRWQRVPLFLHLRARLGVG